MKREIIGYGIGILVALMLSVVVGCTNSLVNVEPSNEGLSEAVTHLQQVTLEDLQAASKRAAAGNDKIGQMCYDALATYLSNKQPGDVGVAGVFDAFEKARLGISTIQAGIPDELRIGCAPLVQDARNMVLRLGIIAGSRGIIK